MVKLYTSVYGETIHHYTPVFMVSVYTPVFMVKLYTSVYGETCLWWNYTPVFMVKLYTSVYGETIHQCL